jgi:hypothetical protein
MRNPRNAGISAILRFPKDPSDLTDLTDLTDLRLPAAGLASVGIPWLESGSPQPEFESTRYPKQATKSKDSLLLRFS